MTPPARGAAALVLLMLVAGTAAAQPVPAPKGPRRGPPPPPPRAEQPLPPAPGEQIAAAAMTHFGDYECEFKQTINVDINRKFDGYVDVRFEKNLWTMKPVLSHTGALRLEDVRGRMLMLQIANKSMLMDTQIGRRIVDNCVHEKQRLAAQAPPSESLGIDPEKAAAAAAAERAASAAAAAASAASAAR